MWAQTGRGTRAALIALAGALLLLLIVTRVAAWPALTPATSPAAEVIIGMAGLQFAPAHVVVSPGDTLRWRNDDTTFHQIIADGGAFTSPLLAPGDEYAMTVVTPGYFPYHCELHQAMTGVLVVGQAQSLPVALRNSFYPTPLPTATATRSPGPTSVVIGPLGGALTAPDGSADVAVPAGAVDRKTTFDYAPVTPTPPPDHEDAGNAFTLAAWAGGVPVTQFGQPITLTLHYEAIQTTGIASQKPLAMTSPAGDVPGLGLFYAGDLAIWQEIESRIDAEAETVTAATDHLTTFALFTKAVPAIYWKAGGWIDYAPSGVPDFDQKQDGWRNAAGQWTHCGPVAVANSLWWFDSVFEPGAVPPPALSDGYGLVQSYSPGVWDDHDPRNVLLFVNNLAGLAGTGAIGTDPVRLAQGIQNYLAAKGLAAAYGVTLLKAPPFEWVAS